MRTLLVSTVLLLLTGCASAPAAPAPAEELPPRLVFYPPTAEISHAHPTEPLTSLDAVYRAFAQGYRDLDPEAVANLYTEDARYLPVGKGQVGRAAIGDGFGNFFGRVREAGARLDISFLILDRTVARSGDLAADVGIYTLERFDEGEAEPRVNQGKFTVVAVREDGGDWRFHVDSFSPLNPD